MKLLYSLIIDITPDLTDAVTLDAFRDVWFTNNAINVGYTPIGDLNDIGKPCK